MSYYPDPDRKVLATDDDDNPTMRVSVVQDEMSEQPDHDGQPYVLSIDYTGSGWRADVLHSDYGKARKAEANYLASAISAANEHYCQDDRSDWLVERYLRMFHDVAAYDYLSTRDGTLLFVLTNEQVAEFGLVDGDTADTHLRRCMEPWQRYLDGEVYGWQIEKLVTWVADDASFPTVQRWEHVESCYGYYDGLGDVEEQALEAFDQESMARA